MSKPIHLVIYVTEPKIHNLQNAAKVVEQFPLKPVPPDIAKAYKIVEKAYEDYYVIVQQFNTIMHSYINN